MPPKVSVVMSVFNGEAYLVEAIDSILHQTFTDFEFIIIDDGSTDSSADIIQNDFQQDSRIRLIRLDENMGLSTALNRGINQAQGQYIARMDCDDISQPERLLKQVDFLDAHPDVCVLGSRMQVINNDKKVLFAFEVPQEHSLIVWNLFFGRTFAHPSVMMRRDALMRVGGYDESLSSAQDVDLWARLIGQGRFANLSDPLVLYRSHENATSIQKSDQQKAVLRATLKKLLTQLWAEDATDDVVARFLKIRRGADKFRKGDYDWTISAMRRLADSMRAKGWILPDERHLIDADMKGILDRLEPQFVGLWKYWRGKFKP